MKALAAFALTACATTKPPAGTDIPRAGKRVVMARHLRTEWPARLACESRVATIWTTPGDAQLAWRSDDGLRVPVNASHLGPDASPVAVTLPTDPGRLQHLDVLAGTPEALTIDVECGIDALEWQCEDASCELHRATSASRPLRVPYSDHFCRTDGIGGPHSELMEAADDPPARLAEKLPLLRVVAESLLDQAGAYLESRCQGRDACADQAMAAIPIIATARDAAPTASITAVQTGPKFELRRDRILLAKVKCSSLHCDVEVPLPQGERYSYGAGIEHAGNSFCYGSAAFFDRAGAVLGVSRRWQDDRSTGYFIRLWRKP